MLIKSDSSEFNFRILLATSAEAKILVKASVTFCAFDTEILIFSALRKSFKLEFIVLCDVLSFSISSLRLSFSTGY